MKRRMRWAYKSKAHQDAMIQVVPNTTRPEPLPDYDVLRVAHYSSE